jgi:hypothetical protein
MLHGTEVTLVIDSPTSNAVEDARRCAVGLLRDLASTLEEAPPNRAADALIALSKTLVELERLGEQVLPQTAVAR